MASARSKLLYVSRIWMAGTDFLRLFSSPFMTLPLRVNNDDSSPFMLCVLTVAVVHRMDEGRVRFIIIE